MKTMGQDHEDISGSWVISTPGRISSPAAESPPDIAGWIFRALIIIGLAVVAYMTFTGRLFQPLFQAAKAAHWSKLVVRPSLWWGMMGIVLLVFRSIAWLRYHPFPTQCAPALHRVSREIY